MLEFLGPYQFSAGMALASVIGAYGVYIMLRAGVFAVPQPGFMAVGAYSGALVSLHVTDFWVASLLAGGVAAAVVGGGLGLALMRLNGIHLAIASIAFNEIVRIIARNLEITGGASGLYGISPLLEDWKLVLIFALVILFFSRVPATSLGKALDVMREDELVASHQGVDLKRTRMLLFALSGGISGLAGSVAAHYSGFIDPTAFGFAMLIDLLAVTVIGGMLSAIGPILGGVVIFGLPEYVAGLGEYRHIFAGLLIALVVAFSPGGVAELFRRLWRRVPLPRRPGRSPVPVAGAAGGPGGTASARPAPQRDGERGPVLEVQGATRHFGGVKALSDVSFHVKHAELLGIIGPNGSGKTTLLNVLSGAYKPDKLRLSVNGRDAASGVGEPHRMVKAGLARTFQGIRLIPHTTVAQNVVMGGEWLTPGSFLRQLLGLPGEKKRRARLTARASAVMEQLGLQNLAAVDVSSLPYGAQRRVEIARALMSSPTVLLLDEPTAGMTAGETAEIFQLMEDLARSGMAVVVVEHDLTSMNRYCHRVVVLDTGTLLAEGAPEQVMKDERVVEAYVGRRA